MKVEDIGACHGEDLANTFGLEKRELVWLPVCSCFLFYGVKTVRSLEKETQNKPDMNF
jgi:hypothetical protein